MAKTNYNRLKEKRWKPRVLIPPNKVMIPDSLYNKKRERKVWKERLREYINGDKSIK